MKQALILLFVLAYTSAKPLVVDVPFNDVFGYLTRFGIPEGERLKTAEESYIKSQPSRIVGGSPSGLGQFTYQAGLIIDIVEVESRAICGGSLVTSDRVLTAAHCWYDGINQAWRFTVVLGSVLLFSDGTRIETTDVVTHPQWLPDLIRNDIAVIRLPESVTLSATIGIISLPSGAQLNENFIGTQATASGFGLTKDDASVSIDQFLNHVDMKVISNLVCSLVYPFIVQSSNVCTATMGGQSTCRGDSGGPLVVESNGEPILIGITSFGSSFGCEVSFPAVFTRITSYIDFITDNL